MIQVPASRTCSFCFQGLRLCMFFKNPGKVLTSVVMFRFVYWPFLVKCSKCYSFEGVAWKCLGCCAVYNW